VLLFTALTEVVWHLSTSSSGVATGTSAPIIASTTAGRIFVSNLKRPKNFSDWAIAGNPAGPLLRQPEILWVERNRIAEQKPLIAILEAVRDSAFKVRLVGGQISCECHNSAQEY
jgi:hypothetical protein